MRDGKIRAPAKREWEATITKTGSVRRTPVSSGNPPGANVRSHWIS
ncbi:hypothetical protein JKI95_05970 [Corynebacterium aquatimens]|nr:hypothetical protein JKI95_05970 [Corynebacterium aquatimens]